MNRYLRNAFSHVMSMLLAGVLLAGCIKGNDNSSDMGYYVFEGYQSEINTAGYRTYWQGEKRYYDLLFCEDADYELGSATLPESFFTLSFTTNIPGRKFELKAPHDANFFFAAGQNSEGYDARGYKYSAWFRDSASGDNTILISVFFYSGDRHTNASLESGTFKVIQSGSHFEVEIDAVINGYRFACHYSGTPIKYKYEDGE